MCSGFRSKRATAFRVLDDVIGKQAFGLLVFEPRLQEIYKSWIKQSLTTPDPYNGSDARAGAVRRRL